MKEFDQLVNIVAKLRGPGGCKWDRAQTVKNYEKDGILPRARRDARGWRYYTGEDILKIKALYRDELVRSPQ